GGRLDQIEGKEECQRRQRPLSTGEQVDPLGAFAARRGLDLHGRFQRSVGVGQPHVALPPLEERLEDALEVLPYRVEGLHEYLAGGTVDLADRRDKVIPSGVEVVALTDEEGESLRLL